MGKKKKKNVSDLYKKLGEDRDLRKKLGKKFKNLSEGDWQGIVDMAKEEGYVFSVDELKEKMPEGFFKGKGTGRKKNRGWDMKTKER
jgi:hypothetical protein